MSGGMPDKARLRIMLVTDRRRSPLALAALAGDAARAGLDDLQVREKDLPGGPLLALVREIVDAVQDTPVRVFVNGRPDVALAAGAHGVQLPEEGLPVADVKRTFPRLVVGASRHSLEGVRAAAKEGADFVVLGPVFATPGKEDRALGLSILRMAAEGSTVPVYAIGGIDAATARGAAAAGAAGIALLRPFLQGSVARTLAEVREVLA
jgi:thiamine-phosphate diphosphorylase